MLELQMCTGYTQLFTQVPGTQTQALTLVQKALNPQGRLCSPLSWNVKFETRINTAVNLKQVRWAMLLSSLKEQEGQQDGPAGKMPAAHAWDLSMYLQHPLKSWAHRHKSVTPVPVNRVWELEANVRWFLGSLGNQSACIEVLQVRWETISKN